MSYSLDLLPGDFISYVKAVQAQAGHEAHSYKLARALQVRVRAELYDYAS